MTEQYHFIGNESLEGLSKILSDLAPRGIFLVHGHKSYVECGAAAAMARLLEGYQVTEFDDFSSNPEMGQAEAGCDAFLKSGCDMIIGVGGGSCMDVAKAIRHYASVRASVLSGTPRMIPLVAMPTTSGTGAEATKFAVLYKDGKKYSLEAEDVLPDYAVVYPPFTESSNLYLTICAGFDAIAQAIESIWSVSANEESCSYAFKALDLMWRTLPKAAYMTPEDRARMAEGAYWAGRAINITRTTAPHAYSYTFTSEYLYPHGHAVALTFPFFYGYNLGCSAKEYAGRDYEDYLKRIQRLKDTLGIDSAAGMLAYVDKLGISELRRNQSIDWDKYLDSVNPDRLANNPRPMNIVSGALLVRSLEMNRNRKTDRVISILFMQEFKGVLLKTLASLKDFCSANGLRWYLAYGSAIGAARHKGMVPWDDDIDIYMPREDYEKLLKMNSFPDGYGILAARRGDYDVPFSYIKYVDRRTSLQEMWKYRVDTGVFVDIFPLDSCDGDVSAADAFRKKYLKIFQLYKRGTRKYRFEDWKKSWKRLDFHAICVAVIDRCILRYLRYWYRSRFNKMDESLAGSEGDYYVSLGSPYPTFKEIYSKEWFKDTTTMQFDGLEVQLPAGYDSLLRQIYGDYMQMPPEDKRESDHHHYILDLKRKLS